MKKKLIVFSADAMVTEDLQHLSTLPNYKKYLAGGCAVKKVRSIYPTITYPCHTTMITGVYPDRHGVCGNFQFHPGVTELPWKWDYSCNHCRQDIFTAAKKAGYSTAAVFWPVTGNHPAIDYLIDEYWKQSPDETPAETWGREGSDARMIEIINRHMAGTEVRKHPSTEKFIVACTCDIIREYKPDLMFLHPANIDAYRHRNGVFNDRVTKAVDETDEWIGEIMEAVKDAGVLEETNFVLTSDHGQMDIRRVLNPNVIFADKGLIRVNKEGSLKDWDAWCLSGGLSDLVYLKDPEDKALYAKVRDLLNFMCEEGIYGISRVFTAEEAEKEHHLKGDFSFVLESDDYTSFGDAFVRPIVRNFDVSDYRYGRATHGHLPEKGPQPVFLASGPDFARNVTIEEGRLIDEAPTYAAMLGVDLPGTDGKPISEFLTNS